MMGRIAGISLALLVHAAIILFGGLLFMNRSGEEEKKVIESVDLVSDQDQEKEKEKEKKEREAEEAKKEVAEEKDDEQPLQEPDTMPDLHELTQDDAAPPAPALDAMSLSALEDALAPASGGGVEGFFTGGVDLASGGRIGGSGSAASAELDSVFSVADLDQRPQVVYQSSPNYPFELRRRKVEGVVYVLFVVDREGKVLDPKVETSTNVDFERAALEAVKQWKFEPAVKDGQKVSCKMRVPFRFSVS